MSIGDSNSTRRRPTQVGSTIQTRSGKFKRPRRPEMPYFKFLVEVRSKAAAVDRGRFDHAAAAERRIAKIRKDYGA